MVLENGVIVCHQEHEQQVKELINICLIHLAVIWRPVIRGHTQCITEAFRTHLQSLLVLLGKFYCCMVIVYDNIHCLSVRAHLRERLHWEQVLLFTTSNHG